MADGAEVASAGAGARAYVRYSEALGEAICARVAAGESLAAVCRDEGMPHPMTVYDWGREQAGFGAALAQAQKAARVAARLADRARAAERLALGRDNRGRWSTYTPEIGEEICRRMADGESLKAIGRDPAMPCAATILNWCRAYPEFADAYALARAQMADVLFDEAREVGLEATPKTVWADRLRFDVIRWMTARMAPKKYCERLVVDAEVAARRAEEAASDPGRAPMTVIVKRFCDVTPEEEAAHDETQARAEARERRRGR